MTLFNQTVVYLGVMSGFVTSSWEFCRSLLKLFWDLSPFRLIPPVVCMWACVCVHACHYSWICLGLIRYSLCEHQTDSIWLRPQCGSVLIESFSYKCVRLWGGAGCCVTVWIKQKQNWWRRFNSVCSDFARLQKNLLPFHQTAEQLLSICPLQSTITDQPNVRPTFIRSLFE